MPLVRIDLAAGKPAEYRQAIAAGVHEALVATFNVPRDDRFQVITEHAAGTTLVHTPHYLGVDYSDDLVIIDLVVSDTRTRDQKKALYAAIVENLAAKLGLRREDVVVTLVETKTENWSFGRGLATYAT